MVWFAHFMFYFLYTVLLSVLLSTLSFFFFFLRVIETGIIIFISQVLSSYYQDETRRTSLSGSHEPGCVISFVIIYRGRVSSLVLLFFIGYTRVKRHNSEPSVQIQYTASGDGSQPIRVHPEVLELSFNFNCTFSGYSMHLPS